MQETIKIIKTSKRYHHRETAILALNMSLERNGEKYSTKDILDEAIGFYDFLRGESPHFSEEVTCEKTLSIQE